MRYAVYGLCCTFLLQACLSTAWAAGTPEDAPFDPGYFAPTPHQLGLLYANPENATCEVLISITELNTTGPSQHQATASPVASSVTSNLTMQIENLLETEYEDGFTLMVELPLGSVMGPAAGAIVAGPRPGSNNTVAFTLSAATPLSGDGMASQMLNTTVTTPTADATPRNIYLSGSRCALALAALNPTNLPDSAAPAPP